MTDGPDHISEHDLSDLLLGKLSDARQSVIEQHLEECQNCEARAAVATPQDGLVELLHRAAKSERAVPAPSGGTLFPQDVATPTNLPSTMLQANVPQADPTPSPPPGLAEHTRYRVIRPLGWGGMGQVWLAEHLVMGRPVALKVIRREFLDRPGMLDRFHREVQLAAKLIHPNIATAFDAEEIGGSLFLVMEFVSGRTLSERVRGGPLPIAEACHIVREAARGLAHAHAAGLVHRDIKPGNLIQADDGTVKVLDFGLAISTQTDAQLTTGDNLVLGTPDYVAPEQAVDPHAADSRADLYSLGCTLYQLLSGRVPFTDESLLKKIDGHRFRNPEPLTDIPDGLSKVIAKLMAKSPADRFQKATELIDALQPFCDPISDQESRQASDAAGVLATSSTRHRLLKRALAVIALFALIGMTWRSYFQKADHQSRNSKVAQLQESINPLPPKAEMNVKAESDVVRHSLLSPTSLGDGDERNYRVEEETLKIDTATLGNQLWLNYFLPPATDLEWHCQLRITEFEESSLLKFVLMADYHSDFCMTYRNFGGSHDFVAELTKSQAPRSTILARQKCAADFAASWTDLKVVLKGTKLQLFANDGLMIEADSDESRKRYPAISAYRCKVDVRNPYVLIRKP